MLHIVLNPVYRKGWCESWGARALSVPTFSKITSSQVCRIHREQGCVFASCLSQFKWRLPLKEAYSSVLFPPSALVLERLHQEWDHGDQYNVIDRRKRKETKYCFQLHQFLDPAPFVALQPWHKPEGWKVRASVFGGSFHLDNAVIQQLLSAKWWKPYGWVHMETVVESE